MSDTDMNDNPPAFPFGTKDTFHDTYSGSFRDQSEGHHPGMTLRDYFANSAMHGLLATFTTEGVEDLVNTEDRDDAAKVLAEASYALAGAMLAARKEAR